MERIDVHASEGNILLVGEKINLVICDYDISRDSALLPGLLEISKSHGMKLCILEICAKAKIDMLEADCVTLELHSITLQYSNITNLR